MQVETYHEKISPPQRRAILQSKPDFEREYSPGCINTLISGKFYASQGHEIYELRYDEGCIGITCSDCRDIVLTTDSRRKDIVTAKDNEYINSAVFKVNEDDAYVRIIVTDIHGRHADTNAYFVSDLISE